MKNISIYDDLNDIYHVDSLESVLRDIKDGFYEPIVSEIRKLVEGGNMKQVEELKRKLPIFFFAGVVDPEFVGDPIKEYSGLVAFEIVGIDKSAEKLIRDIESITTTYCWFQSLDLTRITILVKVDSESYDYEQAFDHVTKFYYEVLGKKIESSFISITKPCFVSFCPDLYYNPDCDAFEIEPETDNL